ncbi:hypothetical protein ACKC9G_17110 [Pokkaliibacter sp. CJK22405]|uniref:hypothetical protein n=1 Tax=Pokkaliibacter sp. CJK22405 TaxID=3384615 RepID=UPI003984B2FF
MKRLVVASVLVAGVVAGTVSYFLFKGQDLYQDNVADFGSFGYKVIPMASSGRASSFLSGSSEPKISPDDLPVPPSNVARVYELQNQNTQLVAEVGRLQGENKVLLKETEKLRSQLDLYKAPILPAGVTQDSMKGFLVSIPEISRMSSARQDLSSAMAYRAYLRVVDQYGVLLTPNRRDQLLRTGIARYAYCIGDAASYIANNSAEMAELKRYLETGKGEMATALQSDVVRGLVPCKKDLDDYVANILMATN